jgi:hypothetical protein
MRTKDFKDKQLGKVNPYGVYDLKLDEGYVSVGIDADAALDENNHERAIKVTDAQLAAVNLTADEIHGEWNYAIKPSR